VSLDDVDGDGVRDLALVVRSSDDEPTRVELRSGADGRMLRELASGAPLPSGPFALATVPDLDGDGRRDLVLGRRDGIELVGSSDRSRANLELPGIGPLPSPLIGAASLVALAGPGGRRIAVWGDPVAAGGGEMRGALRAVELESPR
jgi:hypothetical protein